MTDDETPTAEATPNPETTPPAPTPLRRRGRRGEVPVRYLLDCRLFKLLSAPGGERALESFRASLADHGLAAGDGLPPLELTPLTFLEAIGVAPPQVPTCPLPSSLLKSGQHVDASAVVRLVAEDQFKESPEIQPDQLRKRVEELRSEVPEEGHDLFDLCLTRFVARDGFEEAIYKALAYEYLFKFPFPEVLREGVFNFLGATLFDTRLRLPGSCKIRIIKTFWDQGYERLLRANVGARGEIQALDRELRLRSRLDHLAWECILPSILGHPGEAGSQEVKAFVLGSAGRSATRCIAFKTTLRSLLDQLSVESLAGLRSTFEDWKPGALVSCREDGTFEAVLGTGDLPVYLAFRQAG